MIYLVKVIKDFLVGLLFLGTTSLLLSEKPIKRDALYLFNNIANLSIFYGKDRHSRLVSCGFISSSSYIAYSYS